MAVGGTSSSSVHLPLWWAGQAAKSYDFMTYIRDLMWGFGSRSAFLLLLWSPAVVTTGYLVAVTMVIIVVDMFAIDGQESLSIGTDR